MWTKQKGDVNDVCYKCREKLFGKEKWVLHRKSQSPDRRGYDVDFCIPCGDKKQKKEQEKKLTEARNLISESLDKISQVRVKENNPVSLDITDYKTVKSLREKVNKSIDKELINNDAFLKTEFEILQDSCQEIEKLVPDRVKINYQFSLTNPNNSKRCSHTILCYDEDNPNHWYCGNCGEDSETKFLKLLQEKIIKDIYNDCKKCKVNPLFDFKKSAVQLSNLRNGDYDNQLQVEEDYNLVKNELIELAKDKGIDYNRERERERAKMALTENLHG